MLSSLGVMEVQKTYIALILDLQCSCCGVIPIGKFSDIQGLELPSFFVCVFHFFSRLKSD